MSELSTISQLSMDAIVFSPSAPQINLQILILISKLLCIRLVLYCNSLRRKLLDLSAEAKEGLAQDRAVTLNLS